MTVTVGAADEERAASQCHQPNAASASLFAYAAASASASASAAAAAAAAASDAATAAASAVASAISSAVASARVERIPTQTGSTMRSSTSLPRSAERCEWSSCEWARSAERCRRRL